MCIRVMLNAKEFNRLIARAVGDGVNYAFVLDGRGVVVAKACSTSAAKTPVRRSCAITTATTTTTMSSETEVEDKMRARGDDVGFMHTTASPITSAEAARSCPSDHFSRAENDTSCTANNEDTVYAAVVSAVHNLWRAYGRCDLAVNTLTLNIEPEALEQILVDLGSMRLCAMSVKSGVILCLVSQDAAHEVGMLKLKTAALQQAVFDMLAPILSS